MEPAALDAADAYLAGLRASAFRWVGWPRSTIGPTVPTIPSFPVRCSCYPPTPVILVTSTPTSDPKRAHLVADATPRVVGHHGVVLARAAPRLAIVDPNK